MAIKKAVLISLLSVVSLDAAAECRFTNAGPSTLLMSLPATLSIPRDTPDGTTIYESPHKQVTVYATFACTADYIGGIKNNLGADSPTSSVFPIGNTGLGWQWVRANGSVILGVGGFNGGANNNYSFYGGWHFLRIKKIGPIKDGSSIPAGDLGYYQTGEIQPLTMAADKQVFLASQSCETPDVKVEMGEYWASDFLKSGAYTKPISFSIRLLNCPEGINKVNYRLSATAAAPVWNASLGIVELNKSSTAKGVALQVMDDNLQPIQFDKTYTFGNYSPAGGNFSIPMNARYFRTLPNGEEGQGNSKVSGGTANTEVTFIMSYL